MHHSLGVFPPVETPQRGSVRTPPQRVGSSHPTLRWAIKTRSIRTPSPTGSHHRRSRSSLGTREQRQRKRGRNAQSGLSSRRGPRVRRLAAGGSRIRTRGPALRRAPLTRRATRSPSRLAGANRAPHPSRVTSSGESGEASTASPQVRSLSSPPLLSGADFGVRR